MYSRVDYRRAVLPGKEQFHSHGDTSVMCVFEAEHGSPASCLQEAREAFMSMLQVSEIANIEEENSFSVDVRERMIRFGSSAVSDLDLIIAILGSGIPGRPVRRLAREVLGLVSEGKTPLDLRTLSAISGMGDAKSCAIAAALELGRRLYGAHGKQITCPRDMYPLLLHFADRKHEHFIVISLNGAHEVHAIREVSKGLINRTMVHSREVFADPITDRACAIIVAHNHPSGNLEPSQEDLDITQRLRQSGEILGIPVLDHLIFSDSGFFSFAEHGLISTSGPH